MPNFRTRQLAELTYVGIIDIPKLPFSCYSHIITRGITFYNLVLILQFYTFEYVSLCKNWKINKCVTIICHKYLDNIGIFEIPGSTEIAKLICSRT